MAICRGTGSNGEGNDNGEMEKEREKSEVFLLCTEPYEQNNGNVLCPVSVINKYFY